MPRSSGWTPPCRPEPRCCSPPTTACWMSPNRSGSTTPRIPPSWTASGTPPGNRAWCICTLRTDAGDGGRRDSAGRAWRARFGDRIWAFTREEAVAAGLFGAVRPEVTATDRGRDGRSPGRTGVLRHPPGASDGHGSGGPARFPDQGRARSPAALFPGFRTASGKGLPERRRPPGTPWLSSSSSPAPWTAESPPLRCRWTTTTVPAAAAASGSAATTAPATPGSPAAWGCRLTPWRSSIRPTSGTRWCSAAPSGIRVDYLICDEAQFYSAAQVEQLARVVDEIEVDVFAFGITADFRTRLFPGSQRLIELADRVQVLQVEALCWCGRRATHNARTVDGVMVTEGAQVVVGDVDMAVEAPVGDPGSDAGWASRGLRNAVPAALHAPGHRPRRQHHGPAGPAAPVRGGRLPVARRQRKSAAPSGKASAGSRPAAST